MPAHDYRDLEVWRAAMDLARECYRIAAALPSYEQYGLAAQIRRAAAAVPSNIAEGHRRGSRRGYAYHVSVASGSVAELETQLHLSELVGYAQRHDLVVALELCDRVGRMLTRLRQALRRASPHS